MCADTADTTIPNQELADELHKSIIRKFQKHDTFIILWVTVGVLILLICNKEADVTVRYFAVY